MGTPAQGALAKLAMDSVLPFDTSSEPFEFLSESVRMVQSHVNTQGVRGTRSRFAHRTRIASEQITGSITMQPSVAEIDRLLPRILGGATAGGITALAETVPEFQLMVDRITKVFTYAGCRIGRCVISGSAGQPIQFVLDIEGETESVGNAGTFPAITIDTQQMFVFSDLALTLDGTAREVQSFALTIDNMLQSDRYMNSVTRSEIPAMDRAISLECVVPYTTDEDDLYDLAVAGIDGSLVLADGTTTYTVDFGNLKAPANSPVVTGKTEITLSLAFDVYKTGTTNEVIFTKT